MTPKENLIRAIRRQEPEWVPNGLENVVIIMPPVVERPPRAGTDDFGVLWNHEESAEGGTYPAPHGHTVTDIRLWRDQVTFPHPDAMDWSRTEEAARAVERNTHLVMGFVEMGLFERSYLLLGMEEALIAYIEHPAEMQQLTAAIADYKIAVITEFYRAAHPDIIWYGDDWGTQNGLFLPPRMWRAIIKPHTKRIYDRIRELGMLVDQHSCGKIESIFGDIVEMGASIFNPCQPCNDLERLKREFGDRIAFHGGIDSQFVLDRPGITPEQVRAEVRRRIDELACGGGYIAGPSHAVPYDPEIVAAMDDEIARYGRYPIGAASESSASALRR